MAYLWPIISPPEEYGSEAIYFRDVILEELGPGRHRLLELGVGGGHNLSHLTVDFDCTAVDLSPDMLALSERLNPGVPHLEGDMRSIRLEKIFDAVLIHDASSYILFEEDLKDTFTTAAVHLRPVYFTNTKPACLGAPAPRVFYMYQSWLRACSLRPLVSLRLCLNWRCVVPLSPACRCKGASGCEGVSGFDD